MMTYHAQFLLLVVADWVNRQQQDVIDYLQEENRVLRAGLRGKRLSLSDDDRRRLAVKAQALGREALAHIASSCHTRYDTKLLIYGLFQKGRVLAQDGVRRVLTNK